MILETKTFRITCDAAHDPKPYSILLPTGPKTREGVKLHMENTGWTIVTVDKLYEKHFCPACKKEAEKVIAGLRPKA